MSRYVYITVRDSIHFYAKSYVCKFLLFKVPQPVPVEKIVKVWFIVAIANGYIQPYMVDIDGRRKRKFDYLFSYFTIITHFIQKCYQWRTKLNSKIYFLYYIVLKDEKMKNKFLDLIDVYKFTKHNLFSVFLWPTPNSVWFIFIGSSWKGKFPMVFIT